MSRVLIFLFDGTGSEPITATDPEPTNVFKINLLIADSRIVRRKRHSQVTFYVPGIGTKFTSRSLKGAILQLLFGDGLDEMIMRSYVNLAANYRPGDRIIVIGFSRGAVAARLFSRLVSDFGLLSAARLRFFSDILAEFSEAILLDFDRYQSAAAECKARYGKQLVEVAPRIDFLGLFDCVRGMADSDYQNFLRVIDEKQSPNIRRYLHLMSLHDMRGEYQLARLNPIANAGREVWVPGVHSDVGGGYHNDLLAQMSLLTMALALRKGAGIALEQTALKNLINEINSGLDNGYFAVNREDDFVLRRNRSSYFRENDSLHCIHFRLLGAQVSWKGEGSVIYRNMFKLREDPWIKKLVLDAFR